MSVPGREQPASHSGSHQRRSRRPTVGRKFIGLAPYEAFQAVAGVLGSRASILTRGPPEPWPLGSIKLRSYACAVALGLDDTHPGIQQMLLDGYRRMTPAEEFRRVAELNEMVLELAAARAKRERPGIDERELRLRVASLWLGRDYMIRVSFYNLFDIYWVACGGNYCYNHDLIYDDLYSAAYSLFGSNLYEPHFQRFYTTATSHGVDR
jgi:hypothetical protein